MIDVSLLNLPRRLMSLRCHAVEATGGSDASDAVASQ